MVRNTWYLIIGFSLVALLFNACAKNSGCRGTLANGQPTGCSSEQVFPGPNPEPPIAPSKLRCTVTLNDSQDKIVNSVVAGQLLSLKIEAVGGTAPYSIPSIINSFAAVTSISGSYDNNGSTDRTVEKRIEVRDANNQSAFCSFSAVVKPTGSTGESSLACDIEVTPAQPKSGQVTSFKVKVINGSGNATSFRQLYPQLNWNYPEWTVPVTRISDSEGEVVGGVQYINTGDRIVSTSIENNGRIAICSRRVTVTSPKIQLVSLVGTISSQVAAIGSEFKVQAVPSSFPGTITYQFTTPENGISIVINGDTATIRATDALYHDFKVSVRATSNTGESVTAEISLQYTSNIPLSCQLELTGSPIINTNIGFRITAGSGEAIEITNIIAPVVSVPSSNSVIANPFILIFPTTGTKIVSVKARSVASKVPCNLDTRLSVLFTITERELVCDVVTGPSNTAASGTVSKVQVTVPSGAGPYELIEVRSSLSETSFYDKEMSALWQLLTLRRPGSHTITAKIRDRFNGRTGECSVVHISKVADAFAAGTDINAEPRVSVFTGSSALLSRSFLAFDGSIRGGVRVAMGDVNGDGTSDLIAGAGLGIGSRVRVFRGADLFILRDFDAFPGISMQEVYVASGDVNADGKADIVVGSGCSASQARVRVYNGENQVLLAEIFPYGLSSRGARVAVGDVNGDGHSDIVTSPCTGSDIHIYSGRDYSLIRGIIAYPNDRKNSQIAVGDVTGDGFADIVAGAHDDCNDHKYSKVFDGRTGLMLFSIAAYPRFDYASRVAVGDVTGDGIGEILIAAGGNNPLVPEIKTFDGRTGLMLLTPVGYFRPFGSTYTTNLFVGAGVGGL